MNRIEDAADRLKNLSPADFLALGKNEFAYVRTDRQDNGKIVFTVHDADGDSLFTHESYAGAMVTARQNNLHPFTLQ